MKWKPQSTMRFQVSDKATKNVSGPEIQEIQTQKKTLLGNYKDL